MKTGTAYRTAPRNWAIVKRGLKWHRVTFIAGSYKGKAVFVFCSFAHGLNDHEIAKSAYRHLMEVTV